MTSFYPQDVQACSSAASLVIPVLSLLQGTFYLRFARTSSMNLPIMVTGLQAVMSVSPEMVNVEGDWINQVSLLSAPPYYCVLSSPQIFPQSYVFSAFSHFPHQKSGQVRDKNYMTW